MPQGWKKNAPGVTKAPTECYFNIAAQPSRKIACGADKAACRGCGLPYMKCCIRRNKAGAISSRKKKDQKKWARHTVRHDTRMQALGLFSTKNPKKKGVGCYAPF
jgi:hypothetical protein